MSYPAGVKEIDRRTQLEPVRLSDWFGGKRRKEIAMEEDQGRPVKPHRSGGGHRVSVVGNPGLAIASMMAIVAAQGIDVSIGGPNDPFERRDVPTNTGRRAEKNAAALAKAEAKRQRKAAKRAKDLTPNAI